MVAALNNLVVQLIRNSSRNGAYLSISLMVIKSSLYRLSLSEHFLLRGLYSLYSFCIHTRRASFTNQPIMSKNPRLDIGRLTWTYFRVLFVFNWSFQSFRSRKFVTHLFGILRNFGVYISAKFCGSVNKFNTYFLRSLGPSLFFRK